MISLGGFGGYVVVGFDHTIENVTGERDFRVLGNAFYAEANPNPNVTRKGGSCEPGIVMVAYDKIRMVNRMMMNGTNWLVVNIIKMLRLEITK